LIPTLTALENVLIPTIPMNIDKDAAEERARKLLSIVGLENRLRHKPKELSGGEMQRVSIARALINNPAILYCDEPTGNLDSVTGKQIVELMKSLNDKENKTFVIVTHDPSLVKYANKVFYLKDGMIMKDHTKEIKLLQKIRG
jgi:putative ABC transport system ATP-binding protein